jgi:hypothetical protein
LTERLKLPEATNAQERRSALVIAGALLLIAAWNFYRGRTIVVIVLASIAFALVLMTLLLPALARRFHIGWMKLAGLLGYVNSRVLLSLVFYLLFVPYSLVARLVGRDPLNRRKRGRASYWIPRETTKQAKEQFERLF